MSEMERRDWTPEISLLKALSTRLGGIAEYVYRRRVEQQVAMADQAISATALTPEEFLERLQGDTRLALLFATGFEAAARVANEAHARTLGRVVAQAIGDNALIDESQLLAATIRDLDASHVRALVCLYGVARELEAAPKAALPNRAPYRYRNAASAIAAATVLARELPCPSDVAEALAATLERHGLIWNDPPGFPGWGITGYGMRVLEALSESA